MEYTILVLPLMMLWWMLYEGHQNRKLYPDEEEMMRRLIRLRTDRKMAAISTAELDREIEEASDRLVHGRYAVPDR